MLPERKEVPPYVINRRLARIKIEDCYKTIISGIYHDYQKYKFKCLNDSDSGHARKKIVFSHGEIYSFTEHLHRSGKYQQYLTTLLKDAVLYAREHFNTQTKTQKEHEVRKCVKILTSFNRSIRMLKCQNEYDHNTSQYCLEQSIIKNIY